MRTITILCFIFLFCLKLNCQNASYCSISGTVLDSNGNDLEFANIFLLSSPDSSFITGAYTNEQGRFSIEKIDKKDYILKISYIGCEDYFQRISLLQETTNIGTISLAPITNTIKEVVVTTKTPPFKLSSNGLITNVSTTLLSSLGTANDVIQRIPGVTMTDNGITVFGKGAPIVYINNRKVQDNQELERLESSDISTIELITNPGAKYDAEGRAVLLIKTKKKQNGLAAQVTERIRKAKYFGDNENINISYTKNNLDLFASYYHQYRKSTVKKESSDIQLLQTDTIWKYNIQNPFYSSSENMHQASSGFDWSITDKHSIGGQYQFNIALFNDPSDKINASTFLNDILYDELHSQTSTNEKRRQHLLNAFYNGDFNENYSLRFDFDYLNNYNDRKQLTNETSNLENRIVHTFSQIDYDLYAGKLTNSYQTTVGLFEFGGEYNYITGNGSLLNPEGYAGNDIFSNQEQKAALFVSYSQSFKDAKLEAGLRYEFTQEKFTEDSVKTLIISKKYSDIYPNISISKSVKNVDLNFSFNKRTRRPSFMELNGSTTYVNRFVFQKGDPYLKKTDIYDAEIRAMYKMFHLNMGYSYEKNPVYLYFGEQQENSNAVLSTYTNYPKYQQLNFTINFSKKVAFWQPNYTVNIAKPYFSANYNGNNINYNQANYIIKVYNDFVLPSSFIFSCNFSYYNDYYYYLSKIKGNKRLDLGLRKSLFNNRLRLNLDGFDIFNWVVAGNKMEINNLQFDRNLKLETRYVQLSITYLFNNYKKKYRGSSAAPDDLNRF